MDLNRIIRDLIQERERIQKIIESLEQMKSAGTPVSRPAGKRRGRKSMDAAGRAEVSERMRRYWQQRRKEKEQPGVELPEAAD